MEKAQRTVFIGNIIHCNGPFSIQTFEKGFIAVNNNKIVAVDNVSALETWKTELNFENAEEVYLSENQLLLPGLVDTHFHAPQYPNMGLGYDKTLLEWLDTYTYPLEKKYNDVDFAKKVYEAVIKKTLAYGTTTACYFATLHLNSSLLLVDSAIKLGQRAFIGKVNMTRLAPADYVETEEETLANTVRFVEDVSAKQSHISENLSEIDMVKQKFYNKLYAEVYEEAGLLTEKTVLAHGIYLTDSEMNLLASKGTSVAHCPDSNTCLHSGLCDVRKLVNSRVNVSLGTDISGGNSPSIITAMRSSVGVSTHISFGKTDYRPLNCYDAFYLATVGGAKALGLEEKIGYFEIGKEFDAIVVEIPTSELFGQHSPLELLQKFIYTGDDKNVVKVYVSGKQVK